MELRVVGMSRSGNHAIIGWILAQARGRVAFLNCAEPRTNPFTSARPLDADGNRFRASYDLDLAAEANGELSRKDLLIHSYEDTFLAPLGDREAEARHDEWLGPSARRLDVLILRDPYNLFASRFASRIGVRPHVGIRIWCQHAREFLGLRRLLGDERVVVNYNMWASSRVYRRAIAMRLGLEFDDRGVSRVPGCAGGSSFDGTTRDGSASGMAVTERWRLYAGDSDYAALFTPEVRDLALRIFGQSPAVELLGPPEPAAA